MKNKVRIRIINAGKTTAGIIIMIAIYVSLFLINEILPFIVWFLYSIHVEIVKIRELLEKRNEI
jgi:hypothetical protein